MNRLVSISLALGLGVSVSAAACAEDVARCGTLPAAVADMRQKILQAAEGGSLEDLASLADEGIFTASHGGSDTMEFWQYLAAEGTDIGQLATTLLSLGCAVAASDDTAYYTWPAAIDLPYSELTGEERSVLATLHGGDLESVYLEGTEVGYYIGWQLVIAEDGDWIALVAGD